MVLLVCATLQQILAVRCQQDKAHLHIRCHNIAHSDTTMQYVTHIADNMHVAHAERVYYHLIIITIIPNIIMLWLSLIVSNCCIADSSSW